MTHKSFLKSAIAQAALQLMPPLIQNELIEDLDFQKEYSIKSDAVIQFGNSLVAFQRSELYNAVRKHYSGELVDVYDKNGNTWSILNHGECSELPKLKLCRGEQSIILPNYAGLSPDKNMRLRYLGEVACLVNLPNSELEIWNKTLSERSMMDDEVDIFESDINTTPIKVSYIIRNALFSGQCDIITLVPNSRKYYERLVGVFDGSVTIRDYAVSNGKVFLNNISAWQSHDGFLYSMLLSSHSSLTSEISVNQISSDELERALTFLEKHGDRYSQLGAIEVGLRIIKSRPEIEPIIIRLIEQIRDDDTESHNSKFKLMSSLFILVYGELSRIRIFSSEPPYYRRLAALAQASLICREVLKTKIDINSFCEWAFNSRGQQYYLQSLADMRLEPYWNPDFADASQIKNEFLCRIMNMYINSEQDIKGGKLEELITQMLSSCQESLNEILLPGPLEGDGLILSNVPEEISKAIKTQLDVEEVSPDSFIALINSARIFRVAIEHVELAINVLKQSNHRIINIESTIQLFALLNSLASIAAATRSSALAEELRILVRKYKRDTQYSLSNEENIRICLAAASSQADLSSWSVFVGEWLTELAFDELSDYDSRVFHSHLQCLLHMVPELWITCGRAEAALKAYIERA